MKDFDKIKEKKKSDDFLGLLFIGLVFLLAVGIIVFVTIKLTNQYIELKSKLSQETEEIESTLTNPEKEGDRIVITMDPNKEVKVDEIKKKVDSISLKTDVVEKKAEKNLKDLERKDVDTAKDKIGETTSQQIVAKKTDVDKPVKKPKTAVKNISVKRAQKQKKLVAKKSGKYVIQLMAFKDRKIAEKELNKIRRKLPDAFLMKIDLGKKGLWYRIRCCYTDSYSDAKKRVNDIKKNLRINPIIVKTK